MGKRNRDKQEFKWFVQSIRKSLEELVSENDEADFPFTAIVLGQNDELRSYLIPFGQGEKTSAFRYLATMLGIHGARGLAIITGVWVSRQSREDIDNEDKPRMEPRLDPNREHGLAQYVRLGDDKIQRLSIIKDGKLEDSEFDKIKCSSFDQIYDHGVRIANELHSRGIVGDDLKERLEKQTNEFFNKSSCQVFPNA